MGETRSATLGCGYFFGPGVVSRQSIGGGGQPLRAASAPDRAGPSWWWTCGLASRSICGGSPPPHRAPPGRSPADEPFAAALVGLDPAGQVRTVASVARGFAAPELRGGSPSAWWSSRAVPARSGVRLIAL